MAASFLVVETLRTEKGFEVEVQQELPSENGGNSIKFDADT